MRLPLPTLASAIAFASALAVDARPVPPRIDLNLPAGTLQTAVSALASQSSLSIFSTTTGLLNRDLPEIHLHGSPVEVLARLGTMANARAIRQSSDTWLLVSARHQHLDVPKVSADIIVNATKRDLAILDVPASIDQVSSTELGHLGNLRDTRALVQLLPAIASTNWGPGREKLFLRGIADSSFVGTSPSLTGEYLGEMRLIYNAPDPDLRLYDVVDAQILYGPQGTLYGSGAMGGLVRIEPAHPEMQRMGGDIWTGASDVAHGAAGYDSGATLNLPLESDRVAARAVGYVARDPGYIDNTELGQRNVNQTETRGGRVALRWRGPADWLLDVTAIAQRIDNHDAPYADAGASPLTRASPIGEPSHNAFLGSQATLSGRLHGIAVKSSTSLVHQSLRDVFDVPQASQAPLYFDEAIHTSFLSQEFRASHSTPQDSWVIGADVLLDRAVTDQRYGYGGADNRRVKLHQASREATIFGETSQTIIGGLSGTLGFRYDATHLIGNAIDRSGPFNILLLGQATLRASSNSDHFVPSAALLYKLSGGTRLFARYAEGFRPAGLTIANSVQPYASDRIDTIEIGVRRGMAGLDLLDLSLGAAFSRWQHVQADTESGLGVPFVENIGNANVRSLTAAFGIRLRADLRFEVNGFLARSHLHPTDLLAAQGAHNALPNVVHDGLSASLSYDDVSAAHPFHVSFQARRVGRSVATIGPLLADPQGGYTTLAVDTRITFNRTDVTLDATNLTDSRATTFAIGTPFAGVRSQVSPLRPRTIRIGLLRRF